MPVGAMEEIAARYRRDGFAIMKGVYTPAELASLRNAYRTIWLDLIAQGEIRQDSANPLQSLFPNRLRNYHLGNPGIAAFVMKDRVVDVLEVLLGDSPLAIQTGYYFKPPGTRGLGFHQDNYHIGVHPGTSCAAWVSIDGSDEENGSLLFVPGTHRLPILSAEVLPGSTSAYGSEMLYVPEGYARVQIETEPGDVVLFTGNVFHGSTKNRSDTRYRQSFVTHFARSDAESVTINYSRLMDRHGNRVRKKINPKARIMEQQPTIFHYKDTAYYDQIIYKANRHNKTDT